MRSVLIIGGDSFIGKALAPALEAEGIKTFATSRRQGAKYYLDLGYLNFQLSLPKTDCAILLASFSGFAKTEAEPEVSTSVAHETIDLAHWLSHRGTDVIFLSSSAAEHHLHVLYGRLKRLIEYNLPAKSAVVRLGPVVRAGRHVYPDVDYEPIPLDALTSFLLKLSQIPLFHEKPWLFSLKDESEWKAPRIISPIES